ncbi:hypothetical protein [Geminicoccus flavidas]|uniref:hypothetical protein n=1 Tax=Geminicoccus flavidas TaxID=2506407 RepID=UPI001357A561|nr:hypothetical protein [Geminicoccus flavidas]
MAAHAHIISRQTLLAGIAAASVMSITGNTLLIQTAVAATAAEVRSASAKTTLWDLWEQRCRCQAERDRFDEFQQSDAFWFWEDRRLELEGQIISARVGCLDDLRAKIELMRFNAGPTGPGADDDLDASIAAGFDFLFPRV